MWTLILIGAALALEIAFGLMPDAMQDAHDFNVIQAQKALLGLAAVVALSYRSPIQKAVILVGTIWAVWVLATDWIIPAHWPSWIPAAEGAFFLAWLIYLWRKNEALSRGQETGRPDGDDSVPPAGKGRRRRGDRR